VDVMCRKREGSREWFRPSRPTHNQHDGWGTRATVAVEWSGWCGRKERCPDDV